MAFDYKNLTLVSDTGGFKVYHYKTTDLTADVDTTGYFNAASKQLPVGTRIHIDADTDGTPGYGLMVVLSNAGGVVDVGDMTQIGGTDTD